MFIVIVVVFVSSPPPPHLSLKKQELTLSKSTLKRLPFCHFVYSEATAFLSFCVYHCIVYWYVWIVLAKGDCKS